MGLIYSPALSKVQVAIAPHAWISSLSAYKCCMQPTRPSCTVLCYKQEGCAIYVAHNNTPSESKDLSSTQKQENTHMMDSQGNFVAIIS